MCIRDRCVTALPVVDHDPVAGTREDLLGFDPWRYVKPGKPVLAESLGAVQRAAELGAVVEAGPHLPLVNRLSLETMADWGVERVWLSPELTLGQVADLAAVSYTHLVGSTGFGPFDTTSTILPFCTLWLMTVPAATLFEYSSV